MRNYALVTNTPVNQVINAALADYLEANAADVVHAAFDKGLQQHGEVFDTAGQFVGIGVISTKNRGASSAMALTSMMSGMSGLDSMGMLPIVLPADDIREIAKQALGK